MRRPLPEGDECIRISRRKDIGIKCAGGGANVAEGPPNVFQHAIGEDSLRNPSTIGTLCSPAAQDKAIERRQLARRIGLRTIAMT